MWGRFCCVGSVPALWGKLSSPVLPSRWTGCYLPQPGAFFASSLALSWPAVSSVCWVLCRLGGDYHPTVMSLRAPLTYLRAWLHSARRILGLDLAFTSLGVAFAGQVLPAAPGLRSGSSAHTQAGDHHAEMRKVDLPLCSDQSLLLPAAAYHFSLHQLLLIASFCGLLRIAAFCACLPCSARFWLLLLSQWGR